MPPYTDVGTLPYRTQPYSNLNNKGRDRGRAAAGQRLQVQVVAGGVVGEAQRAGDAAVPHGIDGQAGRDGAAHAEARALRGQGDLRVHLLRLETLPRARCTGQHEALEADKVSV